MNKSNKDDEFPFLKVRADRSGSSDDPRQEEAGEVVIDCDVGDHAGRVPGGAPNPLLSLQESVSKRLASSEFTKLEWAGVASVAVILIAFVGVPLAIAWWAWDRFVKKD
jgi:hypothetical protein